MTMTDPWKLSHRERQILSMLLMGSTETTKTIGRKLGTSFKTVECQLTSARKKIGANNSRRAAMEWWRWCYEQRRQEANRVLAARLVMACRDKSAALGKFIEESQCH